MGNYLHLLNGIGALIGVIIAYLSYRNSQKKGASKEIEGMQKQLGEHDRKIAVLETKMEDEKQRLTDHLHGSKLN
jgi:hypothetical protein